MTERDLPALQRALGGIWPRKALPDSTLYLRLLAPYEPLEVHRALDALAASAAYAPAPAELLQAVLRARRAPGRCPLAGAQESAAKLRDAWAALLCELRAHPARGDAALWLTAAHLHAMDPLPVIALAPGAARWFSHRHRAGLERALGHEVRLVACANPGAGRAA